MKSLFRCAFACLCVLACLNAIWHLVSSPHLVWIGALLVALAPLIQRLRPFDRGAPVHHKVKLPRVSSLVFGGLALVLLTVDKSRSALWWTLACTGGFLLDTYWAAAPPRPGA